MVTARWSDPRERRVEGRRLELDATDERFCWFMVHGHFCHVHGCAGWLHARGWAAR